MEKCYACGGVVNKMARGGEVDKHGIEPNVDVMKSDDDIEDFYGPWEEKKDAQSKPTAFVIALRSRNG